MAKKKQKKPIYITRSFSFKLNLGNYQMADFFCSQSSECFEKQAEKSSEALYEFCKKEVIKSVNKYKEEIVKQKEKEMAEKLALIKKEGKEKWEKKKSELGIETEAEKYERESKEIELQKELKEADDTRSGVVVVDEKLKTIDNY